MKVKKGINYSDPIMNAPDNFQAPPDVPSNLEAYEEKKEIPKFDENKLLIFGIGLESEYEKKISASGGKKNGV